jgi:hypothetical protein
MEGHVWSNYDQFFWANLAKSISIEGTDIVLEQKPIILDPKGSQYDKFVSLFGSAATHVNYTSDRNRLISTYLDKGSELRREEWFNFGCVCDYRKIREKNNSFKVFHTPDKEESFPGSYGASLDDLSDKPSAMFLHEYILPLSWTDTLTKSRVTYEDIGLSIALSTKDKQPALRFGLRVSERQCFEPTGYDVNPTYPHLRYDGATLCGKIADQFAFIRRQINS